MIVLFFTDIQKVLWTQLQAYFYSSLDKRYAPVVSDKAFSLIKTYFADEGDKIALSPEAESALGENFKAFLFSRRICLTGEAADILTKGIMKIIHACIDDKAYVFALTLGEK